MPLSRGVRRRYIANDTGEETLVVPKRKRVLDLALDTTVNQSPGSIVGRLLNTVTDLLYCFNNYLDDLHLPFSPIHVALYLAKVKQMKELPAFLKEEILDDSNDPSIHFFLILQEFKNHLHKGGDQGYTWQLKQLSDILAKQGNCVSTDILRNLKNVESCFNFAVFGCACKATISGYCTEYHYNLGQGQGYISCLNSSFQLGLTSPDNDWSALLLSPRDSDFGNIQILFESNWYHNYDKPVIRNIYKLKVSYEIFRRFHDCDDNNENVEMLFHGTYHDPSCAFGRVKNRKPCSLPDCSICSICKDSFLLGKAGSGGGSRMRLRFGPGMYFTPVSSKAHDYTNYSLFAPNKTRLRSILICKVKLGRTFFTKEDRAYEKYPPSGYDSVYAQSGNGLNYDEYVIYEESRVIPCYLIVYSNGH